jgi:hypothetical protein
MPRRDKERLEVLFHTMFIEEGAAYTLWGSKPMAMCPYLIPFATSEWQVFLTSIFPCNLRKYIAWKTWKKYRHLFPISKFVWWTEKNAFWTEPHPSVAILLINKEKFQEVFNEHIEDFKTVLDKKEITMEDLLQTVEKKAFLKTGLHAHDGLIGTSFGFGRENSWLFEAKARGQIVPLSALWETHEEAYLHMRSRPYKAWVYLGILTKDVEKYLAYPEFAADLNSTETKELKKMFLETRREILEYYKDKDLVEATLNLLVNGRPLD